MHKAALVSLFLGVVAFFGGCTRQREIRRIQAPKPLAENRPDRMLGAVLLKSPAAWFFKVAGPQESVEKIEPAFEAVVKSANFDDAGTLTWETPKDWKRRDGAGSIRFATLEIPQADGKPLEVSITRLPFAGEEEARYVLKNINRWRGQMSQRDLYIFELQRETKRVPTAAKLDAYLTVINGRQTGGPMAGAPFAGSAGGPPPTGPSAGPAAGPAPAGGGPPAGSPLAYEMPKGWTPGRVGGMRKAAFEVRGDKGRLEITVIDLSASAGGLLSNVNRWRGQVQLNRVDEKTLKAESREIDMNGVKGTLVELVGPRETILGVIAPTPGKTWFVKAKGDKELAAQEKGRFEQFVRSLKLP